VFVALECILDTCEPALKNLRDHVHVGVIVKCRSATFGDEEQSNSKCSVLVELTFSQPRGEVFGTFEIFVGDVLSQMVGSLELIAAAVILRAYEVLVAKLQPYLNQCVL
jgi:hypothetical protein